MKNSIRFIVGILLFAPGIFFAIMAVAAWFQGQALHVGFGALCGSLAFFITGFMVVGEDVWHDIAGFFLHK